MNKHLKIGFDAKRAFLNKSGLGNYSRNTIQSLSSFYPDNQYYLFTPKQNPERFQSPQNSVIVMPNNFWWRALKPFWRTYRISDLAQQAQLDLYHGLSHELPIGIEKSGIKSIVTMHDLIFIRFPELYKPADRKIYLRKVQHACHASDKIIAISKQTKHDLVDYFDLPSKKIKVIYQSINPLFFQQGNEEARQQVREKYQLPSKFLLTVGTIEARKNLFCILKAMEQLPGDLPLVIVGQKTSYLDSLQPLVEKLNKRLIFLHQINDQELSLLYQLARVMIYPSVFEGFGLPVAEAQASGCPVITSSVSSLPEAGGEGAHYIKPPNYNELSAGIKQILNDEDYRNQLIEKGFQNAQRFTPEAYATQLMKLYQKVYHA